jgi:hypothetical protein
MTNIDQQLFKPILFAAGVQEPYRHVWAFVNSRNEEYRA